MTLKLRPYQEECIETIKSKFSQGVKWAAGACSNCRRKNSDIFQFDSDDAENDRVGTHS